MLMILAFLFIGILVCGLMAFPLGGIIYAVWQFILVPVFSLPVVTFWQCFFVCWAVTFIAGLFRKHE